MKDDPRKRYSIARAGADEPGVILVCDNQRGLIVARSSEMGLEHLQELVDLANAGNAAKANEFKAILNV